MQSTGHEGAMTEIALALAMAFFSIMVLTLISIGTPGIETTAVKVIAVEAEDKKGAGSSSIEQGDLIVIFHDDAFLDKTMKPISAERMGNHPGRVILAISPVTPLRDVVGARERIGSKNLVVTELDALWLDTLSKRGPQP